MLLKPKKKQTYPESSEREYFRILRAVLRQLDKSVKSVEGIRLDSTDREKMVEQVREIFKESGTHEEALREIKRIFKNIDVLARLNLERAIEECLNETPIIEEADAEYYDEWEYTQRILLKDVEESYFNKLAVILGAMFLGKGIADRFEGMERAMEKRLKQIAVNEVGNIFSQLTKTYQKEANIDFYMWQTMRDEKVRSSHRKREGAFYFWEKQEAIEVEGVMVNPAPDFHPGEDYGCRCLAVPIIRYEPKKVRTSSPNLSTKIQQGADK